MPINSAQEYVNALRKGEYYKGLEFQEFIIKKYTPLLNSAPLKSNESQQIIDNDEFELIEKESQPIIDSGELNPLIKKKSKKPIDSEQLNALIEYELLTTDFDISDFTYMRNSYIFLNSIPREAQGGNLQYALTAIYGSSFAVPMLKSDSLYMEQLSKNQELFKYKPEVAAKNIISNESLLKKLNTQIIENNKLALNGIQEKMMDLPSEQDMQLFESEELTEIKDVVKIQELVEIIYNDSLKRNGKNNDKTKTLDTFMQHINYRANPQKALKTLIEIVLQQQSTSLLNTTHSGKLLKQMLNKPEYASLKSMISNSKTIQYRDLRGFALDSEKTTDNSSFRKNQKGENFKLIKEKFDTIKKEETPENDQENKTSPKNG